MKAIEHAYASRPRRLHVHPHPLGLPLHPPVTIRFPCTAKSQSVGALLWVWKYRSQLSHVVCIPWAHFLSQKIFGLELIIAFFPPYTSSHIYLPLIQFPNFSHNHKASLGIVECIIYQFTFSLPCDMPCCGLLSYCFDVGRFCHTGLPFNVILRIPFVLLLGVTRNCSVKGI